MTYESKGSMVSRIVLSAEPDRSGNIVCDGTNDHLDMIAALALIDDGVVFCKGPSYEIGAEVEITLGKTLEFDWGTTVNPASDIDMFRVWPGGSLKGLTADTRALGDGGFTNTVLIIDGDVSTQSDRWWRDAYRSRIRDISIIGRMKSVYGEEVRAGTGIRLEAVDASDNVAHLQMENLHIQGQYEFGLKYYMVPNAGVAPYVNSNHISGLHITGSEYMVDIDAAAGLNGQVADNSIYRMDLQCKDYTQNMIRSIVGSSNTFYGSLMDDGDCVGDVLNFQGTKDTFMGFSTSDFITADRFNDPSERNTIVLTRWGIEHKPDWDGFVGMTFQGDTVQVAGATRYIGTAHESSSDLIASVVAPATGILRNLNMKTNVVLGAGETITYTVFIDGGASTITCSHGGAADLSSSDTANLENVTEGQTISIRAVTSGGAASVYSAGSLKIVKGLENA